MAMNENDKSGVARAPASLSRRKLLVGAAAGGMLVTAGKGAAVTRPVVSGADPELRAALEKYGGEFGQAGRAQGGDHGDL
jgi:hypothetical protein